jgi:hypothetical protein
MVSHFYKSEVVGAVLIADVLPKLAAMVDAAGARLAREVYGDEADKFDADEAAQAVIDELACYLILTSGVDTEDGRYPQLAPHQLRNMDYAADFFEVDEPEPAVAEKGYNAMYPVDDGDTLPVQVVSTPDSPTPSTPKPVRSTYGVSNDTDLTEESIAEGVIYPFVKKQLDSISEALATAYAPIHVEDGKAVYDLVAGAKAARRAVLVSFLSCLQTDPALQDDGTEIALLL